MLNEHACASFGLRDSCSNMDGRNLRRVAQEVAAAVSSIPALAVRLDAYIRACKVRTLLGFWPFCLMSASPSRHV